MMDWLRLPPRDWSRLPDDILELILSRISAVEDLIVFSAVCRSWRSVAVKEYSVRRTQLPWLMLGENHNVETRGFFSIYRYKRFNVVLQNMRGRRCWGSGCGFLLVLEFDRQFYLFNPLTQIRLNLPPKPIFMGEIDHDDRCNRAASVPGFVRKAFVFRDGSRDQFGVDQFLVVLAGNLSGNLAFARPGGQNWVQVKIPSRVESAAWCNGRLYVVVATGALFCCESKDSDCGAIEFEAKHLASQPLSVTIWDNLSLVEVSGDLLLVLRHLSQGGTRDWHKTKHFHVYQLDFEAKEWVELDDLGDRTLFIDADNSAMCLCASQVEKCKANCIYFVEKFWDKGGRYCGGHDVGIFNMVDGCIEPHFISDADGSSSRVINPLPIWVMPSLC
ncbi:hypothetical protein NMG60_11033573 [Bertholletia excelsa]